MTTDTGGQPPAGSAAPLRSATTREHPTDGAARPRQAGRSAASRSDHRSSTCSHPTLSRSSPGGTCSWPGSLRPALDRGLDPADAGGAGDHPQPGQDGVGARRVGQLERDHGPGAPHLPGRELVVRVAGQPRVADADDLGVVRQPRGELRRRRLRLPQPQGERAGAAQREVRLERARAWRPRPRDAAPAGRGRRPRGRPRRPSAGRSGRPRTWWRCGRRSRHPAPAATAAAASRRCCRPPRRRRPPAQPRRPRLMSTRSSSGLLGVSSQTRSASATAASRSSAPVMSSTRTSQRPPAATPSWSSARRPV